MKKILPFFLLLICGICFAKDFTKDDGVLYTQEDFSRYFTPQNGTAEVHFSPNPENGKIVADFVRQTQKTLLIAAYSLTSEEIGDAIREVKKSGREVEIVCDKQQARIKSALCTKLGGKIDKKSGLMHDKFLVRDDSCVLTGSFNFTNNAIKNNRENFLILCDEKLAKEYAAEFQKILKNNT